MAIVDRVTAIVVPLLEPMGLHLYDVEAAGSTLRITVDANGGVTLDDLAEATKVLSRAFDEDDPMPGSYTLEVSSPGLERRLRTPEHFGSAVGEVVTVKLGPHVQGERRVKGTLAAADEGSITIVDEVGHSHQVPLADITKAKTVFEWGPAPKPGGRGGGKPRREHGSTAGSSDAERRAAAP